MAVVVLYMSTRDGKLFKDRREANAHDKMLEAVELLQELIAGSGVDGIDEEEAEGLAFYLVQEKERTLGALKLVSGGRTSQTAVGEAPDAAEAARAESQAEVEAVEVVEEPPPPPKQRARASANGGKKRKKSRR